MNRLQRSAFLAGTVLWMVLLTSFMYAKKEEKALENSLIRFHVLANSDTASDQELKLKVRDAVLAAFQEDIQSFNTVEEARVFLYRNLKEVEETAEAVIQSEGYNYKAKASLTTDAFPTKKYGNITLPAGFYQSLRIEIGKADGRNWWCVMFPPICYTMEEETLPENMEEALDETLDEETNGLIHYEEEDTTIQLKFKIVEWWNLLEQWITS